MIQETDWSQGNEAPVEATGCGSDPAEGPRNGRKAGGEMETRFQKTKKSMGDQNTEAVGRAIPLSEVWNGGQGRDGGAMTLGS